MLVDMSTSPDLSSAPFALPIGLSLTSQLRIIELASDRKGVKLDQMSLATTQTKPCPVRESVHSRCLSLGHAYPENL